MTDTTNVTFRQFPLAGFAAALAALMADQWSKAAIVAHFNRTGTSFEAVTSFLNFRLIPNQGISFSLFSGGGRYMPWILSGFALAVILALLYQLWHSRTLWSALGYGLIIGGALGNNLFDRVRLGGVIDFIDVHFGDWTPFVFNVADAAISVGVAFLLLDGLLTRQESPK